jgi:hypothetical protein
LAIGKQTNEIAFYDTIVRGNSHGIAAGWIAYIRCQQKSGERQTAHD